VVFDCIANVFTAEAKNEKFMIFEGLSDEEGESGDIDMGDDGGLELG
jgi:hypothetical protein